MKKMKIIYEDKYVIAVDKPSGKLSVSTDKEKERTMFHEVLEYLKKKNKNNKVFIVHRLDKDTSGIMIFAKDIKTKNFLQDNWDKFVRKYVAIVEGVLLNDSGEVRSYLKETKSLITYSTSDKSGKLAITKYKKIKCNKLYSMVEINILTGRKNQIRVHMKDIGNSIKGDKKYGAKMDPIKRLGLCANKLSFMHPITKKYIDLEISIPKEFESLFN